ncbi:hypothetical protein J4219_04320 [Candidatus Woesearchaeota archaeon]|nr:hypothetical protein [Candidatus Woesearchaeota archaeon]
MQSVTTDLDARLSELGDFRRDRVVYLDHLAVRSGSLYSSGYLDCNGLVLIAPDAVALSHYDLSYLHPKEYIPQVLERLGRKSSLDSVRAVVTGGAKSHFNAIKRELKVQDIPVVAEYCDSWGKKCREVKTLGVDVDDELVLLKAGDRPVVVLHDFSGAR